MNKHRTSDASYPSPLSPGTGINNPYSVYFAIGGDNAPINHPRASFDAELACEIHVAGTGDASYSSRVLARWKLWGNAGR